MNTEIIKETAKLSIGGEINFPQVVGRLLEQGVESYHIDFVRNENRYYNAEGESYVLQLNDSISKAAKEFNAEGVISAIRKSQQGLHDYKAFVSEVLKAGCVYYIAYLAGRRVIYFGRNGDFHIEHFPNK